MTDLATVIVTWNNADVIGDALESLLADLGTTALKNQVWLVDSGSADQTVEIVRERFSEVRMIAVAGNIGFGAANNLAMRRMGFGDDLTAAELPAAVYILNPDTVTHAGACGRLFDALQADAEVGAVGARLTYVDGSFQHSAFRFPGLAQIWSELFPTPGRLIEGAFNGRYARATYAGRKPFDVDFTLGATMMLKRDVILKTGLFDEDFFIYCEEIDWAWRIKDAGWRIRCVPEAHVTHIGGSSTSQARPRSLVNLWKSRLLLYDKHFPVWKRRLARQLVAMGMRRRLSRARGSDAELERAFKTVIEMAMS